MKVNAGYCLNHHLISASTFQDIQIYLVKFTHVSEVDLNKNMWLLLWSSKKIQFVKKNIEYDKTFMYVV